MRTQRYSNARRAGVVIAVAILACLTGLPAGVPVADAQGPLNIGQTIAIVRIVQGRIGGDVRDLSVADNVFADEIIETDEDSASKLEFLDDSTLSVGPNSSVTLDQFVYDPEAGNSKLVVNTAVGVARFITGSIGQKDFEVRTPTATIGIRGTIFTVIVEPDGTTHVLVDEGSVSMAGVAGGQQTVPEGNSSTTEPGGEPSEPGPLPPAAQGAVAELDALLVLAGASPDRRDPGATLQTLIDEAEDLREAGCNC